MARISGAAISIRRSVYVMAAVLAAASANAQDQPSVTVDMSVLEELGPRPAEAPKDAITLRPPETPPVQRASPPSRPTPEPEPRSEAAAAPSEPAPPPAPEAAADPAPAPAEPESAPEPEPQVTTPAREPAPEAAASDPAPGAEGASSAEASPAEDDTSTAPPPPEPAGDAAAEEPPAPAVQSAARTPSDESQPTLRLAFAAGTAELPEGADAGLAQLVDLLAADEAKRLVINAFADGSGRTESQARRLSLSRALAVRRYLVENGIRGTRAEIRALGQKSDGGPADRVDLVVVER